MAHVTFGTILREARERKGYDLADAARQLRIRPDILSAIEENDFTRMPARGYTRSMVNAYARLVGLNPTEITRMYLDEAYAYQVGRARDDNRPARASVTGSTRRTGSSASRSRDRAAQERPERPPRQNAFGRTMYDDRRDYGRDYDAGRTSGVGRVRAEGRSTHPSRHAALPNGQYTNFYAGPKAPGAVQSKLPFLIAGGIILVLLVLVLFLAFGRGGDAQENVSNVPITGVADTSGASDGAQSGDDQEPQQASAPEAPESVKVTYEVASGQEAYAVITTDGSPEEQMLSGPMEQSVDVKGTWSFATWASEAVTVTVDGEKVSFDATDANGMPMVEVDFEKYLDDWYDEHPDAKRPAASSSSDDDDADGADASASDADGTASDAGAAA